MDLDTKATTMERGVLMLSPRLRLTPTSCTVDTTLAAARVLPAAGHRARQALRRVGPLHRAPPQLPRLHILSAAAAVEYAKAHAGEAAAARLAVRPLELVEVVVEGDGVGGPQVVHAGLRRGAEAGAGGVLGVGAPQVLRELAKAGDAGQLQLVPAVRVPEAHRLLLPGVGPEHEVWVAPRRLGRLHLVGVVVHAAVRVGGAPLPVPLRQPAEEARAQTRARRLLQLRHYLLLLLGLRGVLDDGVPVEGSAEVHLQDCGELVGVDEVDDGDGTAHEDAEAACPQHQPEAPAESEGDGGLLQADDEGPARQQSVVDRVAEEQGEAGEGHEVGAVPRHP